MKADSRVATLFWKRVSTGSDCWLWTGPRSKGYGRFTVKLDGKTRAFAAHRFSWMLSNGPVPPGMQVCHHCDVMECVNPAHLFLGTAQDNMDDKVAKGRHRNQYTARTHCKRGHPVETFAVRPDGTRYCRLCRKLAQSNLKEIAA